MIMITGLSHVADNHPDQKNASFPLFTNGGNGKVETDSDLARAVGKN